MKEETQNVKITIKEHDAQNLLSLLKESNETGNNEWDESIKRVEDELEKKLDNL